jgi:hypothetical protein
MARFRYINSPLETPYTVYLKHYQSQTGGGGGVYGGLQVYRTPSNYRGNGLGSIFRSVWKFISPIFGSETVRDLGKKATEKMINAGISAGQQMLSDPDANIGDILKATGKRTLQDIGGDALDAAYSAFDPRQRGSGIKRKRKILCALLNNSKLGGICKKRKKRKRKRKSVVSGIKKRKRSSKKRGRKGKKRKSTKVKKRKIKKGRKKRSKSIKRNKRRRKSKKKKNSF